jgi:hypothetical protein
MLGAHRAASTRSRRSRASSASLPGGVAIRSSLARLVCRARRRRRLHRHPAASALARHLVGSRRSRGGASSCFAGPPWDAPDGCQGIRRGRQCPTDLGLAHAGPLSPGVGALGHMQHMGAHAIVMLNLGSGMPRASTRSLRSSRMLVASASHAAGRGRSNRNRRQANLAHRGARQGPHSRSTAAGSAPAAVRLGTGAPGLGRRTGTIPGRNHPSAG